MASDMDRLRQTVESLLKEDKSLNEKDVKAAAGKILKLKPADIGAGVIREVRRKMGIDRPTALASGRFLLTKAPTTEARVVIEGVAEKFGIPGRPARCDPAPSEGIPPPAEERAEEGRPPGGRGESAAARGRRRGAEEGAREGREGARAGRRAWAGEGRGLGHLPGARKPGGPRPVLPLPLEDPP